MDPRSNNTGSSGRTRPPPNVPDVSFEEAVLRAKVAQICDHVGYHAITRDSTNILVDIYRRTCIHLARHCKEAANNNRRIEPTFVDLIQAYDFIGISIPELKEHIDSVKLPPIKIEETDRKPTNRIQRNLLVDELLEAEKNTQLDDQDEAVDKAMSDSGIEEEEKPPVPLLREVFQEISQEFPSPSTPIKADKAKIKREEKPAIPKLKITPLDPSIAEPPSFLPILENIKHDQPSIDIATNPHSTPPPTSISASGSKRKTKTLSKTKLKTKSKSKIKTKTDAKTKTKTKLKTKLKTKPKIKTKPVLPITTSLTTTPTPPPPVESTPTPIIIRQPTPQPVASPLPTPPAPKVTLKTATPTPTPPPPTPQTSSTKQAKTKKKKKKSTNNQFAIVTETVPTPDETKEEYICPGCSKPDDGTVMVCCDSCEFWYHIRCTALTKEPLEHERWDCPKCEPTKRQHQEELKQREKQQHQQQQQRQQSSSSKGSRKRSQTPIEVPVKTKTPEPTPMQIETHAPKPLPVGISSDDLCPVCKLPDDGSLMIQCEHPDCGKWFHGKCVDVLVEPKDSWFCPACVEIQQSAFQTRRRRAK